MFEFYLIEKLKELVVTELTANGKVHDPLFDQAYFEHVGLNEVLLLWLLNLTHSFVG